jgi:hypothetical protein
MEQAIIGYRNGEPVFGEILTQEETIERLKQTGEWVDFTAKFDMTDAGNQTLLTWLFEEKLDKEEPDLADYQRLLRLAIAAGGIVSVKGKRYEFETVPEPEIIVEPEVPTDRNGRPLTTAQIAWSQYRTFSESHSMQECRNRARTDAGFASFMQKNYERESGQVADGVENLNAKAPQAEQIPGNVKSFANNYRTMPTAEIRRQSRYDTNPGGAKEFNFLRDEAIRLGLI